MVGLALTFDLGRYHATPWGAHVNEGNVEWPPSPWRVLRALYAVARTDVQLRERQARVDAALQVLIDGGAPVYELPPSTAAHTRHYMPARGWSPERSGQTSKIIDAFRSVAEGDEVCVWWQVDLDATHADALAAAARALGSLGRSESVCTARLVAGAGPESPTAEPAETAADGGGELTELLCPEPGGGVEAMAVSVTELRRRRMLLPPGTRFVNYVVREADPLSSSDGRPPPDRPQVALLRLSGNRRPGITDAVAVGQALRAALLRRYGSAHGGASSPTLSGRAGDRAREDQHRHAHYLSLADPLGRRIDHLIVWTLEGLGPGEVQAIAALRDLHMRGLDDPLRVALTALGRPDAMQLPAIVGPARVWRSLTPFGLVRHPKRRGGTLVDGPEDQVRRELELRGLPVPTSVHLERGSWHRFRSARAGSSRLNRASVIGLRVEFDRAITGPLAIGALCHFGLGLLVPAQ